MTDFRLESATLTPFDIARLHGFAAFELLSTAYRECGKREALRDEIAGMAEKERMQRIGPIMKKPRLEENIAQLLFAAVILYQASMEAIIFRASEKDVRVQKAVGDGQSFALQWRNALEAVGEETDAFDRYKRDIYDGYRVPLTHLDSQDRVEKVSDISFRDIYCGLRAGWWAHVQLLNGIDQVSDSKQENWSILCRRVGLPDDLFPDDDLVADNAD